MRIYLSGLQLSDVQNANNNYNKFNPNILIAYNLDKTKSNNEAVELIKNQNEYNSLMIDSGAYVANVGRLTNSNDFDAEESFTNLCDFYKIFQNHISLYFNYDILFRGVNSFPVNKGYFERMKDVGLDPIFVMHSFEDYEIEYVLKLNPAYVSIASAKLKGDKQIKKALQVTDIFYDAGIKVHLLGCASYRILSRSKAWSCDASSYIQWGKNGRIIYYSDIEQKEKNFTLNEIDKYGKFNIDYIDDYSAKIYKKEYQELLENISGIRFCELDADHELARLANGYYMLYLQRMITDIQKQNGVDFTQEKFRMKNKNNDSDW